MRINVSTEIYFLCSICFMITNVCFCYLLIVFTLQCETISLVAYFVWVLQTRSKGFTSLYLER